MSTIEILDLHWFNMEEKIQRLGEIGISERIFHLRPIHLFWEGLEDKPFTTTCTDLGHWLVEQVVPRSKMDRMSIKFSLDLQKQKSYRLSE